MSTKLKESTAALKESMTQTHNKTDDEIMSVEDSAFSLAFCIADGKIIIGSTNLTGEKYFKEIPFTIAEPKE